MTKHIEANFDHAAEAGQYMGASSEQCMRLNRHIHGVLSFLVKNFSDRTKFASCPQIDESGVCQISGKICELENPGQEDSAEA